MKKKKLNHNLILLVLMIFSLIQLSAFAQQPVDMNSFTPPSPTAYELGKYGQVPVGLFTGTPNVSIPLYEYKTSNLSVPIGLSYNSNGIKVDELGANVGLGWGLNVGGVISRIVRDRPDETRNDFYPEQEIHQNGVASPMALTYFQQAGNSQEIDSEADLFMFNIGGYSGKFVFGNDHKIVLLPKQDLKIEMYQDAISNGFSITAPNGIVYTFTEKELSRNRSEGSGHDFGEFFITAWYLSSIKHPKGDVITFTYNNEGYNYITSQREVLLSTPLQTGCDGYLTGGGYNIPSLVSYRLNISGKKISQISSNVPEEGKVQFTIDYTHPDATGYNLVRNIKVLDKINGLLENFDFTYLSTANKRVFLQEVITLDPTKKYQMEYVNPSSLPLRLSFSQDNWGYYNGKTNAYLFPNANTLEIAAPNELQFINLGANKSPDPVFAQYGLLKKLTYPTKGYNEFIYEGNTYRGIKEVLPPTQNTVVNVATISGQFGTTTDTKTLTNIKFDQKVLLILGVSFNDNVCSPGENTHIKATVTLTDLTVTSNTQTIFQKTSNAITSLGNSFLFSPGMNLDYIYADLKANHDYELKISVIRPCIYAGANVTYYQGVKTLVPANIALGGLRIKQVIANDLTSNRYMNYFYGKKETPDVSTGQRGAIPAYFETTTNRVQCSSPGQTADILTYQLSSSSLNSLYNTIDSRSTNYQFVTVSHGGANFENGGEEHEFILDQDYPSNPIYGNAIPSAPWTNFGMANGNEKAVKTFKKNSSGTGFIVVKAKSNTYTADTRYHEEVYGYAIQKRFELYGTTDIVHTCEPDDVSSTTVQYYCDAVHMRSFLQPDGTIKWIDIGHQYIPYNGHWECIRVGRNNTSTTYYHPCYYIGVGGTLTYPNQIENLNITEFKYISYWHYLSSSTETTYDGNGANGISVTSNYIYDNAEHMQLTRTETVNGDGTTFITRSKYPGDYTDGTGDVYASAIKDMKSPAVHFINAVIEKTSSIKKPGTTTELVTGSELTKYKQFGAGQYLPAQYFLLEGTQAISNFVPATVNVNGLFTIDSRYKQQSSILSYNAKGKPLTLQRVQDVPASYVWDITERLPLAVTTNAAVGDIAFSSFEGYEDAGWNWGNSIQSGTTYHTGLYSSLIPAGTPVYGAGKNMVPASQSKKFKVSAWVKTAAAFGANNGRLVMNTYDPTGANPGLFPNVAGAYVAFAFSNTANKWQYVEVEIDLAAIRQASGISPATNLGVSFYVYNVDAANTIYVDDMRFSPSDASMKTLTWDNKNRLLTVSDEGDHYQRYEYDAFGRLSLIRDQNENIVQQYIYHYLDATASNYVKTTTPLRAVTTAAQLQTLPATLKTENFTYLDGLGNTTQNVTKAFSGNLSRDVVTPFVYDAFGREAKSYLPFVPNQTTGAFVSNALTGQASYYAAGGYRIPVTSYPYSEKVFDGSPLNLIMEETSPGEAWKLADHHSNRYVYGSNLIGSTTEPTIRLFILNSSNEAVSTANYAANNLNKKITTDANNTITIEYTDKLGRNVASCVQDVASSWLCTYYVYDDFGNVAVIISPKAFKKMQTISNYSTSAIATDNLVFYYKYDTRKRIVEKKTPGSGWEYIVYNPIDQPVLTQTANQRITNEWSFIKYDALGRPVVSGIWSNPSYTTRTSVETFVNSGSAWYESESAQNYSTQFGYTNSVFPTTFATIQQANYYDHYNFDRSGAADATFNTTGIPSKALDDCMIGPGISTPIINIQGKLNKGKLTGTKTKVLDASSAVQWLYSYAFYDEYGRAIQTQSNDALGATDLINNVYDFKSQVTHSHQTHTQTNGTSIPILNNYQYNKAGNLVNEMQQSGTDIMAQISSKIYNDLGQLAENLLHRTNYCNNFLQSVDYSYNIRGWLTSINNLAFSNQGNGAGATNNDLNDLWGMELAYTTPTASLGGVAAYNGNITEKRWKSATDNVSRYYTYSYDKLNRLTNGKYSELVTAPATFGNTDRYKEGNITYDENGNILSLLRSGYRTNATFGTMDQLTYTYKGNQLATVAEAATVQGYNDFKDGNTVGDDYFYDANGNMTQDKNKGIASIAYNRFNLPTLVTYTTGNRSIEYTYNAAGQKLRKKVNNNGSITNTWYCGKFIYNDAGLESFFTSEGRAIYNATATPKYRYEYHFKDQTGNVTMAFSDLNNDAIVNISEVIQQNVYYPFGLDIYGLNNTQIGVVNKFKFNGKELQDDFGLNLYDYGLRGYNPQLGRFNQVDPMAHERDWLSPYNYCSNNPISRIDPDGALDGWYTDSEGTTKFDAKINSQADLDAAGISGSYVGKTVSGTTSDGHQISGDAQGNVTVSLPEVSVLAEKTVSSTAQDNGGWRGIRDNLDKGGNSLDFVFGAAEYNLGRVMADRAKYSFTQAPYETRTRINGTTTIRTPLGNLNMGTRVLKTTGTILKGTGVALGVGGLILTGVQYANGDISGGEAALDATFGLIGFIPGGGWIVSGTYFLIAKPLYNYATKP